MKINGTQKTYTEPITVLALLKVEGYDPTRVAVECCGKIIPRAAFEETQLTDDSVLEIVSFVGGG